MAGGHRTGLGDLIQAWDYLTRKPASFEDELQQKLRTNEAIFNQQLEQNQRLYGGIDQTQPLEQRLFQLGTNPNALQYVLPQLVSGLVRNQGSLAERELENKLNPPPRYQNFGFGPEGIPRAFDPQTGMAVNVPTAPGFIPQKQVPQAQVNLSNIGNPQLSPWENKSLDEAMGALGKQYFDEYRNKAELAGDLERSVARMDRLLEGETTGVMQDKFLAASKILQGFGLSTPALDQSIGKKETAEMIVISNAIKQLQNFKGPTTDFEFRKAYETNPNLLTTPAGRKIALDAIRRDARRARYHFKQVQEARRAGVWDATFVPEDPPENETAPVSPEKSSYMTQSGETIEVDPATGQYMLVRPKR